MSGVGNKVVERFGTRDYTFGETVGHCMSDIAKE